MSYQMYSICFVTYSIFKFTINEINAHLGLFRIILLLICLDEHISDFEDIIDKSFGDYFTLDFTKSIQ